MISRATRNALATIAMVEGFAEGLRQIYSTKSRNKTMLKMIERLKASTQAALKLWPGAGEKDIARIAKRLKAFQSEVFGESIGEDASMHTSFCLGVLEDLAEHLKNEKREAVESVIGKTKRVCQYFDRSLNKIHCYEDADRAVRVWRELEV